MAVNRRCRGMLSPACMKQRKIIYVVTRMIVGGAQETAKYTAEYFHQRGDRVLFVTGPETGREGHLEVAVPTLTLPSMVRSLRPRQDWRAFWSLYRLFRRERPDIVHSRTAKARFLSPLAARLAGVPIVVQTIHGFSFNNEIDKKRALYIALERFSARFCHCNVVVSEADREEGLRLGILKPQTTALVRSGVDIAKMQTADPAAVERLRAEYAANGESIITLVGRLSSPKTPEVFVAAAIKVLRSHPQACFWLVGDGSKRETLEAQIAASEAAGRIHLLGLRTDVAELVAASDIVAHSSTHEGLPKTVLEGMAAGKPVIGTAVGGVPAAIEDGVSGLLVPPCDAEQLAAAMTRLLEDESLRARLATGASSRVLEFALDKSCADTDTLYQTLGQQRRGGEKRHV